MKHVRLPKFKVEKEPVKIFTDIEIEQIYTCTDPLLNRNALRQMFSPYRE